MKHGKIKNRIIACIITLLLIALSVFNIQSSEFVYGDVGSRGKYYAVFILFAILLLIYSMYKGVLNTPKPGLVTLCITIYWSVKYCLSATPTSYDFLSIEYSLFWYLLITFGYNYFNKSKEVDRVFVNLMFVVYLVVWYLNLTTFSSFLAINRPMMPLIYNSIYFLPWILLLKRKPMVIALVSLIILTILSAKRGAILILAVETIYLIYILLKGNISSSKKIIIISGIIAILSISAIYISQRTDGYLLSRLSEEELADGSGRQDINEYGIMKVGEMSSIKELLFGYPLGSQTLLAFGGHNDWLTYMLYYGIVGVFLYLLLYIYMFRGIARLKAANNPIYVPYTCLLLIMLVLSPISTAYKPVIHPIVGMLFVGYAESYNKHKYEKNSGIHIY